MRVRRRRARHPAGQWGAAPIADRRSQRNLGRRHHRRARLGRPPRRGARGRDAHRGPHHRLLEGSVRPDAARDLLRPVLSDDAADDRDGLAPQLREQPGVGAVPVLVASGQSAHRSPGVHGPRGPPGQARSVCPVADAGRPRQPGASRGGGGRARGHLQGLQLQTRRDNARIGARVGGDPDAVSGRVGQTGTLTGTASSRRIRRSSISCANRRWAKGRFRTRSGSSRSTAYAAIRCRSSRATSSIAATI